MIYYVMAGPSQDIFIVLVGQARNRGYLRVLKIDIIINPKYRINITKHWRICADRSFALE